MSIQGYWKCESSTLEGEIEYMEISEDRILIEVIISDNDPTARIIRKHLYNIVWYDDFLFEAKYVGTNYCDTFKFSAVVDQNELTLRRDLQEWKFFRVDAISSIPDRTLDLLKLAHQKI